MVEQIKAKLKLLEKLTDAIRQGLTVEDIRRIFSSRSQLNQIKQKGKEQADQDDK